MTPEAEPFGPTSDYTRIADQYDRTREVPGTALTACYERLRVEDILPERGLVLDAGSGTGQISLPLAQMGYEVRGYDISPAMTRIAGRKGKNLTALYGVADVRRLPEKDGTFDAVLASKLFQHVGDWQYAVRELVRVLKPGGCLLLIDEKGGFKNPVREYLAGLADAQGFVQRLPGVRNREELTALIVAQGCIPLGIDVTDIAWESRLSHSEALEQLSTGIFSEFWSIPGAIYERLLAETERWMDHQAGGRNAAAIMRSHLAVQAFRKASL